MAMSGAAQYYGLHYWYGIGLVVCIVPPVTFLLHNFWTYKVDIKTDLLVKEPIDTIFVKKHFILVWLLYFFAVLVGKYGSLNVVFGLFGSEADTSHSLMLCYVMLWYGMV